MPLTRLIHLLPAGAMVLLGLGLKWWARTATAEDLGFLIRPAAWLVGALAGESPSATVAGMELRGLGIVIDRSCAGMGFLVTALLSFGLITARTTAPPGPGLLRASGLALAAYALTVTTNAGRILTLCGFQGMGYGLAPRLHEAIGALIFLTALVIASVAVNRLLDRPGA